MIISTGMRTDIPAYFSDWFFNRIKAGFVLTRNPYYPEQVLRYRLTPEVVDCLNFCTKNPAPMLERLDELAQYRQLWFVTIMPYGKEIEPHVPEKSIVMDSFKKLSKRVGLNAIGWRYDPIFISEIYSLDFHIKSFKKMAEELCGYVDNCVISFIDLYEKTKRNFPEVREVTKAEQDVGMYNTCGHGCIYCYANYNQEIVRNNQKLHDPESPFLIGGIREGDIIKDAKQSSWLDGQMRLEI